MDRVSDRAVELAVVAELVAAEVPVAAGAGPAAVVEPEVVVDRAAEPAAVAGQVVDR